MMAGVVVPRDSANTVGRSTNVTTTRVLPSVERIGSHGPTRKAGSPKARVSQYDIQDDLTPDGSTPVAGSPVAVPSGWWLLSVEVHGGWDDIFGGYDSDDVVPFGAWIAHRPSGEIEEASGPLASQPVNGGTVTPLVAVSGSGEGDVTIITRFDPCEAP